MRIPFVLFVFFVIESKVFGPSCDGRNSVRKRPLRSLLSRAKNCPGRATGARKRGV